MAMSWDPDALGSRVGEESRAWVRAFTRVPSALSEGLLRAGASSMEMGATGCGQVAKAAEAETDSGLIAGGRTVVGRPSLSALSGATTSRPAGALTGSPAAGSLPGVQRSNAVAPLSASRPDPLGVAWSRRSTGRALLLAGLSLAGPLAYSLVVLTGASL